MSMSWQLVILMDETGVIRETTDLSTCGTEAFSKLNQIKMKVDILVNKRKMVSIMVPENQSL